MKLSSKIKNLIRLDGDVKPRSPDVFIDQLCNSVHNPCPFFRCGESKRRVSPPRCDSFFAAVKVCNNDIISRAKITGLRRDVRLHASSNHLIPSLETRTYATFIALTSSCSTSLHLTIPTPFCSESINNPISPGIMSSRPNQNGCVAPK